MVPQPTQCQTVLSVSPLPTLQGLSAPPQLPSLQGPSSETLRMSGSLWAVSLQFLGRHEL